MPGHKDLGARNRHEGHHTSVARGSGNRHARLSMDLKRMWVTLLSRMISTV